MNSGIPALLPLLAEPKPAGGAALDQVMIASGAAGALTVLLLVLGHGHRTGRIKILGRLGTLAERAPGRGMPGWAALPSVLALLALVTALLGMYWDISLHISRGRDEGPLANIAHYPILIGLFGIFAAGAVAVVMPKGPAETGAAIRIARDWHAPVGGLLVTAAGFYALLGFPLDDVWHRLFGQDVTLWGPTHLMLIGGAGLSLIGMMVLEREGTLAWSASGRPEPASRLRYLRRVAIAGGLLIGLSVFQAEWDFGVPQFRMVHQPLLIALAAGCALVVARLWAGRGAAVLAVVFYLLVRGGVSVAVGPVIGELWASVPLYFAEALCVELAALALIRRPLPFGAVSGLLIGTAGFGGEYVWTQFAMRLPWTGDMVIEGMIMAVAGGVAGGLLGALLALAVEGALPRPAVSRTIFAGSILVVAAAVANGLFITVPQNVQAQVTLSDLRPGTPDGGAGRTAHAQVRIIPADAVGNPSWLDITAWQGGDLKVARLERTAPGTYRTTEPMPLHGDWKTLIRLQDGRHLAAVPIYLPADPAIDAPELAATGSFTRPVQAERHILQRELKQDVPGWIWTGASSVVLLCTLLLIVSLGWGAQRLSRVIAARPAGPAGPAGTTGPAGRAAQAHP